jgi:hypothetical protein
MSLSVAIADLLAEFSSPVPTHAIRTMLAARGRPVTAEHLGRAAAYERTAFLRDRMPPLLCSAINPEGQAVRPRWWALGDWRLQRRILTPDALELWRALLAEKLCRDLGGSDEPASPDLERLARQCVAQIGGDRYFDAPQTRSEWRKLRDIVVELRPGVTHSMDSPTAQQHEAEARLQAASTPAVELFFGRD